METPRVSCRFAFAKGLTHHYNPMAIFRALGFGVFLLILSSLMPAVFGELATTMVTFLQSSQKALGAAGILASYAGNIPLTPTFLPPQAP